MKINYDELMKDLGERRVILKYGHDENVSTFSMHLLYIFSFNHHIRARFDHATGTKRHNKRIHCHSFATQTPISIVLYLKNESTVKKIYYGTH